MVQARAAACPAMSTACSRTGSPLQGPLEARSRARSRTAHVCQHSQLRLGAREVEEPAVLDAVPHGVPPGVVVQLDQRRPAGPG